MPSLKDLDINKELKIKILLKGSSGTGKTVNCTKIAGTLANEGHCVLYLDQEKGAIRELKKLTSILNGDALNRIYFEKFTNFKDLDEILEIYKKRDEKLDKEGKGIDKIKLVIIDPMPLIELIRSSVRNALIDQGYYYMGGWGEATKEIKNDDLFELRGSMYSIANTWMFNFLNYIANSEYDLICCLMYPTETKDKMYKYRSEYDGKFDFVYETISERDTNSVKFKANVIKKRGCLTPISAKPIDNLLGELLEIFKEKYAKNDKKEVEKIVDKVVIQDKVVETDVNTTIVSENKNVSESTS